MTRFAACAAGGTGKSLPLVVAIAGLRSIHDHRRTPRYLGARPARHKATLEALVKPAAAAGRRFEPVPAKLLAWQQHHGTSPRDGLLPRTTDTLHARRC